MSKSLVAVVLLTLSANTCAAGPLPLSGLNILVLGESHMSINTYLISSLPDELAEQGAQVVSFGACGAHPDDWLKTKSVSCSGFRIGTEPVRERPADIAHTQPIGQLIGKYHPNLLLLVMGDTMASYDANTIPKSWVWQTVSALTDEIRKQGIRCVWVGPAWGEDGGRYKKTNTRAKEFSDYLSTIVAPCTYVDSLTFSKIGEWKTFDGQHFDKRGYESWSKAIAHAIMSTEILDSIKR